MPFIAEQPGKRGWKISRLAKANPIIRWNRLRSPSLPVVFLGKVPGKIQEKRSPAGRLHSAVLFYFHDFFSDLPGGLGQRPAGLFVKLADFVDQIAVS